MAVPIPGTDRSFPSRATSFVLPAVLLALPSLVVCADAQAATVRDVAAFPSTSETRIVVAIEGAFRFRSRTSDDGRSVQVDIPDATLGDETPRVVPVADPRVDGVLLLDDRDARIVRVSIDLAGTGAPSFDAESVGGRLVLRIGDARSGEASPAGDASQGAVRAVSPKRTVEPRRGSTAAERRDPAIREGRRPVDRVADRPIDRVADRPIDRVATSARPAPKPLVVLDPGHGGKDPGAKAWTGEWEKDIVLDLAQRVARRLRDRGDIEVVMTRSEDRFVELADRRDASRRWNADAFVSIHANASASTVARGIETYYHSRNGGSEARRLAKLENAGRTKKARGGAAVAPMSASKTPPPVLDRRAESIRLARLVQGELVSRLGMRYEAVRDLGAKEGPFFVIGNNAAPSVLVEAAFLTHREEGVRMGSEVFREQIADGVARGIVAFLEQQRRAGAL